MPTMTKDEEEQSRQMMPNNAYTSGGGDPMRTGNASPSPLTPNQQYYQTKMGGLVDQYQNASGMPAKAGTVLNMLGTTVAAGGAGIADSVKQNTGEFWNALTSNPTQQPTQSTALPSPTNMAQGNNTTQQNTISDLAKQSNESYNLIGQQAPANQLGTGNGFAPASPLQRQPSPAPQPAPLVSYGAMGAFTDTNASLRDQLAARNTPEALAYDIAMRNRVRTDNGLAPIDSPFAPIQVKNGADLGDMISLANFNRQGQQDVAQQRQKIYESLTGQFKESPEDMQVINAAMSNGATSEELLAIGSQPDTESRKDGLNKLLKAMQQEQGRKQERPADQNTGEQAAQDSLARSEAERRRQVAQLEQDRRRMIAARDNQKRRLVQYGGLVA